MTDEAAAARPLWPQDLPVETLKALAFRRFCTPPGRRNARRREEAILAEADAETVSAGGLELASWRWRATTGAAAGAVILVHGWGSAAAGMTSLVKPMLERGLDVVAYDGPAHGASDGRLATLPGCVVALRAVAAASRPVVAMVGHSFGGMVAAHAAAADNRFWKAPPGRIAVLNSPDLLADVVRRFAAATGAPARAVPGVRDGIESGMGCSLATVSTGASLASCAAAVLIVHDRNDLEVTFAEGQAIAAAVPQGRFLATERFGHERILLARSVLEAVADFAAG